MQAKLQQKTAIILPGFLEGTDASEFFNQQYLLGLFSRENLSWLLPVLWNFSEKLSEKCCGDYRSSSSVYLHQCPVMKKIAFVKKTLINWEHCGSGKYFLQIPPLSKNDLYASSENFLQRISIQANYWRQQWGSVLRGRKYKSLFTCF